MRPIHQHLLLDSILRILSLANELELHVLHLFADWWIFVLLVVPRPVQPRHFD
jgi:hypothetical protein